MFVVKIQNYKESLVRQLELEICVDKASLEAGLFAEISCIWSESACVTLGPSSVSVFWELDRNAHHIYRPRNCRFTCHPSNSHTYDT